ncbi:MAG TPA: PEP-CTERM sorting domain-containing protein [Telluria sp.]
MKYIAAAVTAMLFSAPVQAALHIFEFTASVNSLANPRQQAFEQSTAGVAPGSVITLGDRIVGRFSYDSSTVARSVESSIYLPYTTYNYSAAPSPTNFFNFTVIPSGQKVNSDDAWLPWRSVWLKEGKAGGRAQQDSLSIGAATSWESASFDVNFVNATGTWFVDGKLPELLSLADMTSAYVAQEYISAWGERIMLRADVTSLTNLTVTAVPEPGTWAMLLAGLTILGFSARRKRG